MLSTTNLLSRLIACAKADGVTCEEELAALIARREVELQLEQRTPVRISTAEHARGWRWDIKSRRKHSRIMKAIWERKKMLSHSHAIN